MNLKNIATFAELEEVAEDWYQRTIRLRKAVHDDARGQVYTTKAARLFVEMMHRTNRLGLILSSARNKAMSEKIKAAGFKSGGIVSDDGPEFI